MLLHQLRLAIFHKQKRQRKKQWNKLVVMCGFDKEGLVNYAKIAQLMADNLTDQEFYKLSKRHL